MEREKDAGKEIEVSILKPRNRQLEVELDGNLNVIEVEVEDPRDQ